MNIVQKVRQTVDEIIANKDPMKLQGNWDLVGRLLTRLPVDQAEVAAACKAKDSECLDRIVALLEKPAAVKETASVEKIEVTSVMREALKAFRKRLKLTRLDDESGISNRQLTGGAKSQIDAIVPPKEYPDEVWKQLARAGVLKHTGQGFYLLVEGAAL